MADQHLIGTEQDDFLAGGDGNDTLEGLGGNDLLAGGFGNNTLDGGAGDDSLFGATGDDLYLPGGGVDTVSDAGGNDELRFAAGVDPNQVERLRPSGTDDLVLHVVGTSDQVTISNWFSDPSNQIERITFADGTVWDPATASSLRRLGTEGDDALFGGGDVYDTLIEGFGGNDLIAGGSGNDTLDGGAGDDTLFGGSGDDVYVYAPGGGSDTISDFAGNDELRFGAGVEPNQVERLRPGGTDDLVLHVAGGSDQVTISNWFSDPSNQIERVTFADGTVWDAATSSSLRRLGTEGDDFIFGGTDVYDTLIEGFGGNDLIAGGSGNDTLDGGAGDDTLFGGGGDDVYLADEGSDTISDFAGNDELRMPAGVSPDDVQRMRPAGTDDLVLQAVGSADSVTISGWFTSPDNQIERVVFDDGTVWDAATTSSLLRLGTEGDDFLQGSSVYGTQIEGFGGNDYLLGGGGDDTIDGGPGDDFMLGLAGDDLYLPGTGTDRIYENGGNDTLRFGAGISPDQVERIRPDGSNDLVLHAVGSSDDVTVLNWFSDPSFQIEQVEFDDGTVWNAATSGSLRYLGTESGENLFGNSTYGALLEARGGDDLVFGGVGDDTLDGGAGNDTLVGSGGDDVYLPGTGQDVIFDAGGSDELRMPAGVTPDEVQRTLRAGSSDDLVLQAVGSPDKVTIINWFRDPSYQIERVEFDDGTLWDAATASTLRFLGTEGDDTLMGGIYAGVIEGRGGDDELYAGGGGDTLDGGTGNDFLEGGVGNDVLEGGAGDDLLDANFGDDTLIGGAGNDTLAGGAGADTYLFDRGDGQDFIYGFAGSMHDDTLQFGADIAPADVELSRDGQSLLLQLVGSSDQVLAAGHFINGWSLKEVRFDDGTSWDAATLAAMTGSVLVANSDAASVAEDATTGNLVPQLLANDSEADAGATFSMSAVDTSGTVGTVAFDAATQTLTYSADAASQDALATGEYATDTFNYTVADSHGATSTATVYVQVTGVNDAPVATGETFALQGFMFPQTLSGNVLANDTDPDHGTILRVANGGIYEGTFGTFSVNGKGQYTYVDDKQLAVLSLAQGQVGTDQFAYTVTDDTSNPNDALSATTFFTVNIVGLNDAPVAQLDESSVQEDTALTASGNVLANDFDYDQGTVLTVASPGTYIGLFGTLVLGSDGNYTYTLANDSPAVQSLNQSSSLLDPFAYSISDGMATGSSQISIIVTGVNDAPVARADSAAVNEDATTANLVPALLANDTDVDDGPPRITAVDATGTAGTVSFNAATQTLTYAADTAAQDALAAGQTATDTFAYTVSDPHGATSSATVTVTVTGVNDAPVVATPLADQTAGESNPFTFQVPAGTFSDVDSGDTLVYAARLADGSALPSWLTFNAANRTFTGTPGHGDIGTASVQVIAVDTHARIATDVFAITTVQTVFNGTAGADTLTGSVFNDTLSGLGGNDSLIGGAGNDTLDGGAGINTLIGGTGDDTYVVSSTGDVVTENANGGNDTILSTVTRTLGANVENLVLTGPNAIDATGNALNNLLRGNSANNTLNGAAGFDALEGGAGNDTLNDTSGGNYYNGGAGADTLTGGTAGDFFIGGTGNDTINTGNGADVIAFNAGDGQDRINSSSGVDDVLSLGGSGLAYANLTFQKSGSNLILNVSATDRITFASWYSGSSNKNVLDLQVVAEAMAGFNPNGGNALLDNKVEEFNFQGLVGAFDAARAANPGLNTWALTNALTQFQLAGSDTAALGGDLAYQYGLNGTVAGIGFDKAQDVVTGAGFGTQAQTLHPLASLQDGVTPLS